jgi:transposase, IS30 family
MAHKKKIPHKRIKRYKHLSVFDRALIGQKRKEGFDAAEIAQLVKRNRSTVIREIARNGSGTRLGYRPESAHTKALERRAKRGVRPLLKNELIQKYVVEKMKLWWSPEQISLRLPIDQKGQTISPEAIYQYVYAQVHRGGNGTVKRDHEDLRPYLTRRHTRRQKKGFRQAQKAQRPVLPSIEDRPASVDKRKEIGHWEDDTMVSRESTGRFKTINERVAGAVLIGKMKDGSVAESNRIVCERLGAIPPQYRKTLTRDRGTENFGYKEIEKDLTLSCYFAHAYCSQERGSNENLNGLIRRFFPKKTDLAKVTDEEVRHVEYLLNTRPRKRHGGKTPLEVLFDRTGCALTY